MRKTFPLLVLLGACALSCSSSSTPGGPASVKAPPAVTPTPGSIGRLNPDVVEETATYTVERYKKSEYIKVDAT
ncbi:MAG TPA: hypothetical protein VEG84_02675, partial [Thermoanaerobaculia bacterium]|nr:hypothetical protein [Thermoanaerobaculia bacterium]